MTFRHGSVVVIESDVYLFGTSVSSCEKYAYKYDTLNDTYAKLTDIPYGFALGSAVAIENNIYLLGGNFNSTYRKYAYKYDKLTDTYTQLTDIPYEFYDGSAVTINNDIYLLGSRITYNISYKISILISPAISKYKYDKVEIRNNLLNNDYTELPIDNGNADISNFSGSLGTVLNNEIYLFGTSATDTGLSKISRKYNPLTNTYTQLAGAPISSSHNGSAITLNNTIYLFFYSLSIFYAYKYNVASDTYTELNSPPSDLGKAISAVLINNKIYLIGETRIYEYDISTNSYILLSTIPVTYYRTNNSSL